MDSTRCVSSAERTWGGVSSGRQRSTGACVTAVLLALFLSGPVRAQVNGGFESGDFSGWMVAGTSAASIIGLGFGSGPSEGAFQALVTNGSGSSTLFQLNLFFAIPPTALPGLGNGSPTQGSGVRQVLNATPGDGFAVDWNFLTNESALGNFNDFGFAVVEGVASTLANTDSTLLSAFSPTFARHTGFQTFCFAAPAAVFSVGFGVVDVSDTNVDSALLVDNLRAVADSDGDSRLDPCDNCPNAANANQADNDGDGIGNACDPCNGAGAADTDSDGVCDGEDNCPLVSNPGQQDTDSDGIGNACNEADDADGDEWKDALDNCPSVANPTQVDSDFDSFGNACDTCNGFGDRDRDGDGRCDQTDNCPSTPNPGQADSDFDGFGNACDTCVGPGSADSDADSRCDDVDNCPAIPNPGQADFDGDGRGDSCDPCVGSSNVDADGDGDCNEFDNCPAVPNPSQSDCDFDGLGDACDLSGSDADGDGVGDACDNCLGVANADQADPNGDGLGEACSFQGRLDTTGCYEVSDTLAAADGSEPVFAFNDIAGTGTVVPISSHQTSGAIPLGFSFTFYGTAYTQVFVSSNGFLSFLGSQGEGCCGGSPIPGPDFPNAVVTGLWAHLHPNNGEIFRQTVGAAPSRQFILEFKDVVNIDGTGFQTWQIVLSEGSNLIEVHYLTALAGVASAGIENPTGRIGFQFAGPNDPVSLVNQAVRYSPTAALTTDGDGDGDSDCLDNCPTNANANQLDGDSDGIGDVCDFCGGDGAFDTDMDLVCDGEDNCPMASNPIQFDDDFDGIGNECDICFGNNLSSDQDGDGFCDNNDNCPLVPNPGQVDDDFDGDGDACDPCQGFSQVDSDGDVICDDRDNCLTVPNPSQSNCDFDSLGDACDSDTVDADSDDVADACDNCLGVSNSDQHDSNGDDIGDACEEQGQLDTRGCYRASDTIAPPDGTEPAFAFVDISGTGTVVPIASHQISAAIPLGFDFSFYGVVYSQLFVSANGFVSFINGPVEGSSFFPSVDPPNATIGGAVSHLHPALGEVTVETVGTAPNRRFIVQYENVQDFNSGRDQTFQIVLDEASGDIVVQYVQAEGVFISAGIENATGTGGLQAAGPGSVALFNEAIRYAPTSGLSTDDDGDAAPNCADNCPGVVNPDQADTDSDGTGDACNDAQDSDGDEWANSRDNCPTTPNVDQADGDFDSVGDACDTCSIDGVRGPLEQCDDGNFNDFDCCSFNCIASAPGQSCGGISDCAVGGGVCDNAGVCQFNLLDEGTECRAAFGECDRAEVCDGINPTCPFDLLQPSGSTCRASAGQCDLSEFCNGFSSTCPTDLKSTLTCRSASGPCDVAEQCSGVTNACPPDGKRADGFSCSDGAFCNGAEVCHSGSCDAGSSPCVGSCNEASDACTGCPSIAQSCRSAGKSLLIVKHPADAAKQKLVWKWLRGEETLLSDFGDPRTATGYLFCLYAGTAQALIPGTDITTPANAERWKVLGSKGFKYFDSAHSQDGVQKIGLKGGADGKARTMLIGKGAELPPLTLPLTAAQFPLTVQLVNGHACWSSTFPTADKNQPTGFKAKTQ